jgi:hypothetical protein
LLLLSQPEKEISLILPIQARLIPIHHSADHARVKRGARRGLGAGCCLRGALCRNEPKDIDPEASGLTVATAGPAIAVLLGLLLALFPAPVWAQEESVADVARRERERKKAQEQAAEEKEAAAKDKDKDGFIWVKEGDRDAEYNENSTQYEREAGSGLARTTAADCRDECVKQGDCRAYKYVPREESTGRTRDVCTTKTGDPFKAEAAEAATDDSEKLGAVMVATLINAAFLERKVLLPSAMAKYSDAEKRGLGILMLSVVAETVCRRIMGRFLTLEEMEAGACKDTKTGATVFQEDKSEIEKDPNYAVALTVAGDVLTVAMTPKKAGLTGFYYDGAQVHAQPGSAATGASPSLGTPGDILKSIADQKPNSPQ